MIVSYLYNSLFVFDYLFLCSLYNSLLVPDVYFFSAG
jgi:hypothetical protein